MMMMMMMMMMTIAAAAVNISHYKQVCSQKKAAMRSSFTDITTQHSVL